MNDTPEQAVPGVSKEDFATEICVQMNRFIKDRGDEPLDLLKLLADIMVGIIGITTKSDRAAYRLVAFQLCMAVTQRLTNMSEDVIAGLDKVLEEDNGPGESA